jgi:hypothetical protein
VPDAAFLLQIAGLVGATLAAIRLFQDGLYRRYRVLFCYLIFRVISGTIPLILKDHSSRLYLDVYLAMQPPVWAFYVLMVREIYNLALANHKGLHSLGRWAMYIAVAISVTLSYLTLLAKITAKTPVFVKRVGQIFAIDRGVNFALVLFILLILFFLSRYPVPLSRNIVRHTSFLFIYFLSNTAGILLRTLYGKPVTNEISLSLMAVATLMVYAWLFLLTPAGEKTRKVLGIAPEHEEHILRQLDALNATLLKISRN